MCVCLCTYARTCVRVCVWCLQKPEALDHPGVGVIGSCESNSGFLKKQYAWLTAKPYRQARYLNLKAWQTTHLLSLSSVCFSSSPLFYWLLSKWELSYFQLFWWPSQWAIQWEKIIWFLGLNYTKRKYGVLNGKSPKTLWWLILLVNLIGLGLAKTYAWDCVGVSLRVFPERIN